MGRVGGEGVGDGVRTHANSNRKIPSPKKFSPEEDRTHNAASSRTASPTHYQRATAAPLIQEEVDEEEEEEEEDHHHQSKMLSVYLW